ncbi:hypothetical protein CSUI_002839, partial [Cystoisospora suis]
LDYSVFLSLFACRFFLRSSSVSSVGEEGQSHRKRRKDPMM